MEMVKKVGNFFKRITEDYIGEYAAQCSYYTFLSLIPFAILLLSLIKYIDIDKETLIYILEAFFPKIMEDSAIGVIQEVYSKSIETISISIIFLLWSAGKGFYSLSKGISAIYKDKEERQENYILLRVKGIIRNYYHRFFNYYCSCNISFWKYNKFYNTREF